MLTVALHARWSGQPNRTAAVRRFIEYVLGRSDVTFMRRLDIARWWLDNAASWQPIQSSADNADARRVSANLTCPEGCESGRIGRSRKPLCPRGHRGFESHSLRHRSLRHGEAHEL